MLSPQRLNPALATRMTGGVADKRTWPGCDLNAYSWAWAGVSLIAGDHGNAIDLLDSWTSTWGPHKC